MEQANPFTSVDESAILGPGTLDMALPLVEALRIRPGMRVLEVGGGTGQVATILAKAFDVTVFTLEPWHGGEHIQERAAAAGVGDRVIGLRCYAQELPFAAGTFDAVLSINSFEMIADDRPAALAEMVRVARPGARVGIAEPMCLPALIPPEIAALDERGELRFQHCFRTVEWNRDLFTQAGLAVTGASYCLLLPRCAPMVARLRSAGDTAGARDRARVDPPRRGALAVAGAGGQRETGRLLAYQQEASRAVRHPRIMTAPCRL